MNTDDGTVGHELRTFSAHDDKVDAFRSQAYANRQPYSTADIERALQASRTDLHAEPIGSATLALSGSKVWTLVPASESHLLRPSVASDGRAFFRTRRAHGAGGALAIAESGAAHYVVEQSAGDVLWVPTWCWHRVDYQARAWR